MTIRSDQVVHRPSLYALICLARHVQRVRQLLKARVEAHKPPLLTEHREYLASVESQCIIKSWKRRPDQPPSFPPLRRGARQEKVTQFDTLLRDLDHHLGKAHHRSLEETAADGDLFLEHNVRFDRTNSLADACHVFDLSTGLLARLECTQAGYHEAEAKDSPHCGPQSWSIHDEKTVANLEHLLYSLQQDAWNALVQHFLRIIDADRDHWDRYWQQMGQLDDGWFAEWPNGRRPLSTTWPWNIKPSLVVLWGVCWMFVYPERGPHNDAGRSWGGGRPQWSNIGHAEAQAQAHTPYGQSLAPVYGTSATTAAVDWPASGVFVPELSPAAATATTTATATATAMATATARLDELSPMQPHLQCARPSQAENLSSPLRYRPHDACAASTSYNSNSTGLPFACNPSLTDFFSVFPSSNDSSNQAWSSDIESWTQVPEQSAPASTEILKAHPYRIQVPHASPHLHLPPSYMPEVMLAPRLGNPDYINSDSATPVRRMQRNPDSHSDNSDSQQYPSSGLSPNSDQPRRASTMSVNSYQPGVPPTQSRTEEPPRDAEGSIFCSHVDCSTPKKTFQRKCEWSKHMDKHERPHKCSVAGCEKLSGFTYAGGLLRHEREVHNLHGGPKASRKCPYADCKRSTGSGFTRKENLQEHLRRVHRGVEDRLPKLELEPELGALGGSGGSRKRRRNSLEGDTGNISDEGTDDTQDLVKRLKQEVVVLQEKVQRLENQVASLVPRSNRRSS